MMKKIARVILLLLVFVLPELDAQDFSRIIEVKRSRMNGADVTKVQQRLVSLGFKKVGAIDGWYGPLTEGVVKTVQYYMGFPRDGRITRAVWNTIFDSKQDGLLRNIAAISNYKEDTVTVKRNGTNNDFDEFTVATVNKEVKTVTFRHVNDGLIIFRFKLWYLADGVFIIQDVYYGDYTTHVYLKRTQDFLELKNGAGSPADPAMEGILKRANEGIQSAGFTVPPLIPADQPVKTPAAPASAAPASAAPAPAAPAKETPAATPAPAAKEEAAAETAADTTEAGKK